MKKALESLFSRTTLPSDDEINLLMQGLNQHEQVALVLVIQPGQGQGATSRPSEENVVIALDQARQEHLELDKYLPENVEPTLVSGGQIQIVSKNVALGVNNLINGVAIVIIPYDNSTHLVANIDSEAAAQNLAASLKGLDLNNSEIYLLEGSNASQVAMKNIISALLAKGLNTLQNVRYGAYDGGKTQGIIAYQGQVYLPYAAPVAHKVSVAINKPEVIISGQKVNWDEAHRSANNFYRPMLNRLSDQDLLNEMRRALENYNPLFQYLSLKGIEFLQNLIPKDRFGVPLDRFHDDQMRRLWSFAQKEAIINILVEADVFKRVGYIPKSRRQQSVSVFGTGSFPSKSTNLEADAGLVADDVMQAVALGNLSLTMPLDGSTRSFVIGSTTLTIKVDNTAPGVVLITADGIIVNRQALENKLRELGVEMNDIFMQAFIIHELTEALAIKRGLSEGAAHTAGLMAEAYYVQNNAQAKSDLSKFWQAREETYGAWGEKQAARFTQEAVSNPLVPVRVISMPWEHPELDTYIPEASRNFSGIMKRLSVRARANVLNVGSGINPIEPLAGDSYRVYNLENQDLEIKNLPAGFRGDFSDKDFFNLGTPNRNAGPDVILFYNMWVFMGIYGSVGGHANTRQTENAKQYINQALQFIRPGGYIVFVFDFHA
ncbi:MAG: hypothetical protein NTZ63_06475, partial [Candidatus Omnitrophica bacterium]|nr:hypothetical protein [Candidatus Omnitrophota bacterium]